MFWFVLLAVLFVVVVVFAISECLRRQGHLHNPDLDYTVFPTHEPLSRGLRVHLSEQGNVRVMGSQQ